MTLELWFAFAAASLVMAVIPGPGVAAIVGFAVGGGRRAALAAVAGMAVGNALAISVSLAGAGAILAASALAFTILKLIGAGYLVVLGCLALARSNAAAGATQPAVPPRTAFLATVAVGTFHPKTILFFMAFAAQFIDPARGFLGQAAILVATFTLIAATTDTLYALAAARAAHRLRNPRWRSWSARAGGTVLIAAGLATAAMKR